MSYCLRMRCLMFAGRQYVRRLYASWSGHLTHRRNNTHRRRRCCYCYYHKAQVPGDRFKNIILTPCSAAVLNQPSFGGAHQRGLWLVPAASMSRSRKRGAPLIQRRTRTRKGMYDGFCYLNHRLLDHMLVLIALDIYLDCCQYCLVQSISRA
jgi:hypothetical protein